VATATGGPSSWAESGYCLRRPGDPGCALPCPAPSLNRLAQRRPGAGRPCDTGYVIRTAQITGLFDLSPLLAVPSREVHERSTAGTSQVSKRSAETGAATAKPRAGSTMAGRCLLHGSAPSTAIPRYQQGSRDGPRTMRGPDRRPASDLLGLAGHRDPAASGSVNRTFRLLVQSDPTTRTGFMIADAVRYMSVHSWTQWDSHGLSGTSSG